MLGSSWFDEFTEPVFDPLDIRLEGPVPFFVLLLLAGLAFVFAMGHSPKSSVVTVIYSIPRNTIRLILELAEAYAISLLVDFYISVKWEPLGFRVLTEQTGEVDKAIDGLVILFAVAFVRRFIGRVLRWWFGYKKDLLDRVVWFKRLYLRVQVGKHRVIQGLRLEPAASDFAYRDPKGFGRLNSQAFLKETERTITTPEAWNRLSTGTRAQLLLLGFVPPENGDRTDLADYDSDILMATLGVGREQQYAAWRRAATSYLLSIDRAAAFGTRTHLTGSPRHRDTRIRCQDHPDE